MQTPTPSEAVFPAGMPARRWGILSQVLLAAGLAYALAAAAALPRAPTLIDATAVFCAGAIPGLLVVLVLWMVCPRTFQRPLRQVMVASALAGAALVAVALYLIVG